MKRIADEVSLHGRLETISMMDLRSGPGEVLASVGRWPSLARFLAA